MKKEDGLNLQKKADQIRKDVIRVAVKNKAGHIAPSLSCVDILTALYYDVMKPEDHFILSKSHGCYGLYSILADKGLIPKEDWENFNLSGCSERMVDKNGKPIIEAGCGSLGHGLPIAVGIAWGLKLQGKQGKAFCLMGDGETQEGTTWEAIQFAVHHKLDNLYVLIDDNKLQAMDFTENIIKTDLYKIFKKFGTHVFRKRSSCNIKNAFNKYKKGMPNVIIFDTIKGYGLRCAENKPEYHFRVPSEEELNNYKEETWKDINGYEGLYQISNIGRIKSYDRVLEYQCNGEYKREIRKSRLMKYDMNNGYYRIGLNKNGVQKKFFVHRLVAENFIKNPNNKNQVNHKNFIVIDNSVENLEWVTCQENLKHAHDDGRLCDRGEECKFSKLKEKEVIEIKKRLKNNHRGLQKKLAEEYNISTSVISQIKSGESWSWLKI